MRAHSGLAIIVFALLQFCGTAHAEKRLALIIGNSAYERVAKLPNPANDASAVADLFRSAGFDAVSLKVDLKAADLRRAVREFSDSARDADVAVVYFAGHGIEVDGVNYLIPVDAKLATDLDIEDEAVSLDRVLKLLEPAKRLRLVILDACRDNPFVPAMKRGGATRSIGRGLARVEAVTKNTVVAYAAQAGTTAADGVGAHSPFTDALLKNITVPGRDLRFAFGFVRDEVRSRTGGQQEPFFYASLGGETFALVDTPSEPARIDTPAAPPPPPAVTSESDVSRDYQFAERVGTTQAWDAFLGVHGTGLYADLAREQRRKLDSAQRQTPPVTTSSTPAPPPSSEPAKPAPPAETKVAAVTPTAPVVTPRVPPEGSPEMVRMIQTELKRVACYSGPVDGRWTPESEKAVASFNKQRGLKVVTRDASSALLETVRAQATRVCPLTCGRGFRPEQDRCVAIVCKSGFALNHEGECRKQTVKAHRPVRRTAAKTPTEPSPAAQNEPPPSQPGPGCIGFRRHGLGGFGGFGGRLGC